MKIFREQLHIVWHFLLFALAMTGGLPAPLLATAIQITLRTGRVDLIPSDFDVKGVEVSSTGRLLFWSATKPEFLVRTSDQFQLYEYGANQPPIAAGFVNDSVVDVLANNGGRVLRIDLVKGYALSERFILGQNPSSLVTAGSRVPCAWIVSTRNSEGDLFILSIADSGETSQFATLLRRDYQGGFPDSLAQLSVHISTYENQILISTWWKPYRTYRYDNHGHLRGQWDLPGIDSVAQSVSGTMLRRPTFVALPVFSLGESYIQTISDLTTDLRIVVVVGPSANPLYRVVNAPIGIVAAFGPSRRLYAIRMAGRLELVTYEWTQDSDSIQQ